MKTKRILFLSLIFGVVLFFAGCQNAKAQQCGQAGEHCETDLNCCTGLTCVATVCVNPGPGASTTAPGPGASTKCDPAKFTEYAGVCFPINTGLSEKPVYDIVKNLLYWILGVFGLLAIIAFVISGVQYLTSAGDEKGVETAKRNMKWSVVGVIVALSGYVIILAIDAALKVSSTTF